MNDLLPQKGLRKKRFGSRFFAFLKKKREGVEKSQEIEFVEGFFSLSLSRKMKGEGGKQ